MTTTSHFAEHGTFAESLLRRLMRKPESEQQPSHVSKAIRTNNPGFLRGHDDVSGVMMLWST